MSVSFIRIDDRMIHGQTCTRWAREYPCDGLIAVNDKAAKNDVLKAAYKAASGKKTFVWTLADFEKKSQKVLDSDTRYFLITKNPIDMCKILVDQGFKCGIDTVIVNIATTTCLITVFMTLKRCFVIAISSCSLSILLIKFFLSFTVKLSIKSTFCGSI